MSKVNQSCLLTGVGDILCLYLGPAAPTPAIVAQFFVEASKWQTFKKPEPQLVFHEKKSMCTFFSSEIGYEKVAPCHLVMIWVKKREGVN